VFVLSWRRKMQVLRLVRWRELAQDDRTRYVRDKEMARRPARNLRGAARSNLCGNGVTNRLLGEDGLRVGFGQAQQAMQIGA
jgi:hypothetical protein